MSPVPREIKNPNCAKKDLLFADTENKSFLTAVFLLPSAFHGQKPRFQPERTAGPLKTAGFLHAKIWHGDPLSKKIVPTHMETLSYSTNGYKFLIS